MQRRQLTLEESAWWRDLILNNGHEYNTEGEDAANDPKNIFIAYEEDPALSEGDAFVEDIDYN